MTIRTRPARRVAKCFARWLPLTLLLILAGCATAPVTYRTHDGADRRVAELHAIVVAPLDDKATFEEVHALCGGLAALMVARHPDLITTEFYKAKRGGRLYFDTARNALGATFVAAYSLRGKPGAPVSTPIEWRELDDKKLRSDTFTLANVRQRLAKRGDPWRDLRKRPGSAAKALKALAKL